MLSCGEKLGGVGGMVLPRDTPEGGSFWALLPPPPPQPVVEWGPGGMGTAVVPGTGNAYQGGYFKDASELRQGCS